uniref:Uncharacterized protein n=1 Tax=Meloidogyne javanica TaxID=6303 RepID=A0A915MIA0_MELJA
DYMPTTEAAGVRIVVHEQDQEPFPDTFGYSAPTGFVSSFGLKTKILHRLDAPYGKCSDTFRPAGYIYAEHYSPENTFETAYSAASWPAQNFNIGQDDCALVLGNNFTMASCTEYYRKNTAYIEIYYEQLNYEKLKETPGYTAINLFSDLGGNIGLWIGFSLITVLEIVELVFECFAYGCKQCIYRPLQRKAQMRRNRRQSLNEENLNGEIEQKEGFRHAGTKISRHISLLEPGYLNEGPAQGGHGHQYQRRWAGTMRNWKRPTTTQYPKNIPPFFEQKFGDVQKEKKNENGSSLHDTYNIYTYSFENPLEEKKGGASPSKTTTHFPALL